MEIQFFYPAVVDECPDGSQSVFFPDFPEAATHGSDLDQALARAVSCLQEAVSKRIEKRETVPIPSQAVTNSHYWIVLPAQTSAKAALYLAMRKAGISKVALARRLNHDEKEVRRLLDPRHPSKLPRIEAALAALNMRLVVEMRSYG